jgi:ubiquinone/menaquinone biosynthesis C-methylase UbiE
MEPIDRLVSTARFVGADWTEGPYYEEAEPEIDRQWTDIIWPLIKQCDFSCVVEIGAGHGRNSEKLRHLAKRLIVTDINIENIVFLRERFEDANNVVFILNDGATLKEIPDSEATFVYSFDAMVHFDSDVVRSYLREFYRVLQPGGFGFCHYSNYSQNPTGSYRINPAWRNFMSRELFEHYAAKEGLAIAASELKDWLEDGSHLDCVTLFQRPFVNTTNASTEDAAGRIEHPEESCTRQTASYGQRGEVAELRRWVAELDAANSWLSDQRARWERLAHERGIALDREQAWKTRIKRRVPWARPFVRFARRVLRRFY